MLLVEHLRAPQARLEAISEGEEGNKNLYLKGCFIQGDVRNHNQRIYPVSEINNAVSSIMEQIKSGETVIGECDHPEELTINLDRVSHIITEMNMNGADGVGKLKILPTPCGNIVRTLIESGVNLGVSSRGSGNVDESGYVSDFEIVTIDIVAKPSAPGAYPQAVYENRQYLKVFDALGWERRGYDLSDLAEAVNHDRRAQKYLKEGVTEWLKSLK
jgi:hypothetical protein